MPTVLRLAGCSGMALAFHVVGLLANKGYMNVQISIEYVEYGGLKTSATDIKKAKVLTLEGLEWKFLYIYSGCSAL